MLIPFVFINWCDRSSFPCCWYLIQLDGWVEYYEKRFKNVTNSFWVYPLMALNQNMRRVNKNKNKTNKKTKNKTKKVQKDH